MKKAPFDPDNLVRTVAKTTRAANQLPGSSLDGGDYEYYASFPAFQEAMGGYQNRILGMLNQVAKEINTDAPHDKMSGNTGFGDADEVFDLVTEAVDVLLEKADSNIDTALGLRLGERHSSSEDKGDRAYGSKRLHSGHLQSSSMKVQSDRTPLATPGLILKAELPKVLF